MTNRRRHRLATRVTTIIALALTFLPTISTTVAHADDTITHLWSQPLRETNQPVVGPTGTDIGVNENCDWAGGDTAYQDFTPDDVPRWTLSNSGDQQPSCGANSYIDAADNTYLYMHVGPVGVGSGQSIASYDATGTVRWTDSLVGGGSGVQRFAMGFDGNLYALYDYNEILRVNPVTGSGLTMGYIHDAGFDTALTTYPGGVVVGGSGSARAYSYGGALSSTMNLDAPLTSAEVMAFGAAGATYLTGCDATGRAGITAYPSVLSATHWTWMEPTTPVAGCDNTRIAPTPDGGAVVSILHYDNTGLTYYGLSSTGTLRWTHVITPPGGPDGFGDNPYYKAQYAQPIADATGTVVLPSELRDAYGTCIKGRCAAQVDFVSQVDGSPTHASVDLPASNFAANYEITGERLYAAHAIWNGSYALDAYDVPGLGSDYQTSLEPGFAPGASIAAPAQSDAILTRQLQINLVVNGVPATSYQYGWLPPGTAGTPAPKYLQICHDPSGHCRVTYGVTTPDQTGWRLIVRAVTAAGVTGPWVAAVGEDGSTSIKIPSAPILVALGDSVTSGHHRLSDTVKPTCEDPTYGYPFYAWQSLNSELPPAWRHVAYYNYAVSGFSTTKILNGAKDPSTGKIDPSKGMDACGNSVYTGNDTPIARAQETLRASQSTWVRIVITAGIDDTNWVDVIAGTIIPHYLAAAYVASAAHTPVIPYTSANCNADALHWNGNNSDVYNTKKVKDIQTGVEAIVAELLSAKGDPPGADLLAWILQRCSTIRYHARLSLAGAVRM